MNDTKYTMVFLISEDKNIPLWQRVVLVDEDIKIYFPLGDDKAIAKATLDNAVMIIDHEHDNKQPHVYAHQDWVLTLLENNEVEKENANKIIEIINQHITKEEMKEKKEAYAKGKK